MGVRVLVVDDDAALAEMLGIILQKEGFEPSFCADGESVTSVFRSVNPDLVLLDVMLPGKDGIAVAREIRMMSGVPLIMLTARTDTLDVVRGLEAGADDYIVKPFNPQELVARMRARLRRRPQENSRVLEVGDLVVNVPAHEVVRGTRRIALTPLEFDLLVALGSHPGEVIGRDDLLEQVWGYHHRADNRLVNVHVQRLRSKIEHDPEQPQIIQTVRGIGYKASGPA